MAKRKISKAEMDRRMAAAGRTRDKEVPKVAKVEIEDSGVRENMAAMAATMQYMTARQDEMSERIAVQLEKMNLNTKARVTITSRNSDGAIEEAEIEVIGGS